MVAQVFGARYADRTDRLVLNCSAAKLDLAGRLTFQNWIDISEAYGCGSRTLAELIAVQALSRTFLDGPDGAGAIDMIQDILERSNRREVYQRACRAMMEMDLRPHAAQIKAPTLVIGGDEDIMTPWEVGASGAGQSWLAENIPNAVKHVIRGSNHSTLFDNTEENMRVGGQLPRRPQRPPRRPCRNSAPERAPHLTPALSSPGRRGRERSVPPAFPLRPPGGGGQGEVGRRSGPGRAQPPSASAASAQVTRSAMFSSA